MKRIFIYPKDVQWLTGKSERQARNIVSEIKKRNNKEKHQLVTVEEFCSYMGLEAEKVVPMIR